MATSMTGAPANQTQLVLLGTMAGPIVDAHRAMAGAAVVTSEGVYLFDCGYGVVGRLHAAGLRLSDVRAIFFTHHHSDHNADYPSLIHLAWIQGLKRKIHVLGPPPTTKIHAAALAFNAEDIDIRVRATGRTPPDRDFEVAEITGPGLVYQDEAARVSAVRVDHPPFAHAFGFRIEAGGRSIVISGDTAPCDALIEAARGADILVHEAMHEPGIDAMLARRPYVPPGLRAFLAQGHTSARDCGRIAARAGVGALVLTHLLPADAPDEVWLAEATIHYAGPVIVGRDLMVL